MSASTHINITHTYYVIFVPKLLVELRIDSNKLCNVYMFQILFQSNIADHRWHVSDANWVWRLRGGDWLHQGAQASAGWDTWRLEWWNAKGINMILCYQ